MGLIEKLYQWKHGEEPSSENNSSCNNHNFGEWQERDRSDSLLFDEETVYTDYSHELTEVAVKYHKKKPKSREIDKSNPIVVPYNEVATEWCKLSGQQYTLVTANKKHQRKCHCGKIERGMQPVKYIAIHTDTVIGTAETRDEIDEIMISHDKKFS